jgi:plastocyanin
MFMDKRHLLGGIGVTVILIMTVFLFSPQPINAVEECKIVKLSGHGLVRPQMYVRIEPEKLVISKGTCVVWVNFVAADEITVSFREGKKCLSAVSPLKKAKTPGEAAIYKGWKLDEAKDCFVTSFITEGQTSSLIFSQPGTYKYEVQVAGKGQPVTGQLVVE